MGLDVTLYKWNEDRGAVLDLEDSTEEKCGAVWEAAGTKYAQMTDEEKDEIRAKTDAIREQAGLDKWGEKPDTRTAIERDSKLHPEHMFKVGYFRSSYNSGGINQVLEARVGRSLYDVFDPKEDEYHVAPDWPECLNRAWQLRADFREALASGGNVRATRIGFDTMLTSISNLNALSEGEAVDIYLRQRRKYKPRSDVDFSQYANRDGHFFMNEPLPVLALLPGCESVLGKRPVVYAVYDASEEMPWYLEALDVVVETCEHVLNQSDPTQFTLSWSA